MCAVLRVSRSGYYAYTQRLNHTKPDQERGLRESVQRIHDETGGSYGTRRMAKQLQSDGAAVGRMKARRLMQEAGVQVKRKKRIPVTTASQHAFPIAPNLLQRQFKVAAPNRVWVGDITYVWTAEGWAYLAVVLDLFSRRIVGWAMAPTMPTELVASALTMAMARRPPSKGLIFHSDRGSQYASVAYQQQLQAAGIRPSMSGVGNCYDNAVCERFFRSLKHERTEYRFYQSHEEARRDVSQYMDEFYNTKRLHSTLGYQSPLLFEVQYHAQAA